MITQPLVEEFKRIVGRVNVLTSREGLRAYSYDSTTNWVHEPDLVLFPTSAQQVSAIIQIANAERIPVIPRGGGTNGSGGSVPIRGGIVVCTAKMNRILGIDKRYPSATVEPGVVLFDLNFRLAKEGLFFPPDPQSAKGGDNRWNDRRKRRRTCLRQVRRDKTVHLRCRGGAPNGRDCQPWR